MGLELGNAIKEIHNCYFNQGEVKTDGVDLTLRTNFDLGGAGKLTNVLQASWQNKYTIDGGVDQVGDRGPRFRAVDPLFQRFRRFLRHRRCPFHSRQ